MSRHSKIYILMFTAVKPVGFRDYSSAVKAYVRTYMSRLEEVCSKFTLQLKSLGSLRNVLIFERKALFFQ